MSSSFWLFCMLSVASVAQADTASQDELYTERSVGNPNAPIVIHEYLNIFYSRGIEDRAKFHKEALPKLMQEYIYTGKVRFVIRELPVKQPGKFGNVRELQMARCASPDRYSQVITAMLEAFKETLDNKSSRSWRQQDSDRWDKKSEEIARVAGGMSGYEIRQCLSNQSLENWIWGRRNAYANAVPATPALTVNGQFVFISDYSAVKQYIQFFESRLAKKSKHSTNR